MELIVYSNLLSQHLSVSLPYQSPSPHVVFAGPHPHTSVHTLVSRQSPRMSGAMVLSEQPAGASLSPGCSRAAVTFSGFWGRLCQGNKKRKWTRWLDSIAYLEWNPVKVNVGSESNHAGWQIHNTCFFLFFFLSVCSYVLGHIFLTYPHHIIILLLPLSKIKWVHKSNVLLLCRALQNCIIRMFLISQFMLIWKYLWKYWGLNTQLSWWS